MQHSLIHRTAPSQARPNPAVRAGATPPAITARELGAAAMAAGVERAHARMTPVQEPGGPLLGLFYLTTCRADPGTPYHLVCLLCARTDAPEGWSPVPIAEPSLPMQIEIAARHTYDHHPLMQQVAGELGRGPLN